MPRTMWKGAISFGLVSIPISMYTATSEKGVHFDLLHSKDQGKIKYLRKCSVCQQEVEWSEISRGYEYQKGQYIVLSDDELEAVPLDTAHTIDIIQFSSSDQVDPVHFQKSYYLIPDPVGVKAYALLREAMNRSGKIAVAKVVLRQKEHLVLLRPYGDTFIMETMFYPDEIRQPSFEELERQVEVKTEELSMAESLIDGLTKDFSPEEFHDRYREALLKTIEQKIAGEEVFAPQVAEQAKVIDLMSALRASVEQMKGDGAKEKQKAATGSRDEDAARKAG